MRVTLLAPAVLAITFVARRAGAGSKGAATRPPTFLFGFVAFVALNSLGLLRKPAVAAAERFAMGASDRNIGARHENVVQGSRRLQLAPGGVDGR